MIFDLNECDSVGYKHLKIQDIIAQSEKKEKARMVELMDGCRALRRNDGMA